MKKLLSILAAVGLTATTAGSAVACGTKTSAKNVDIDPAEGTASFETSVKLPKGTVLAIDEDDSEYVEVIPYKATNAEGTTPFLGVVTKPEKEVKVDTTIDLTELNDAEFIVSKSDLKDNAKKAIGTDNNVYVLDKDTIVDIAVVLDINKALDNEEKQLMWTLVDLESDKDGYKITNIQNKVDVDLKDAYSPWISPTAVTKDNKVFVIDASWIDEDKTIEQEDITIDQLPKGIEVVSAEVNKDDCSLVVTLNKSIEQTDKEQEFNLSWKYSKGLTLTSLLIVDALTK